MCSSDLSITTRWFSSNPSDSTSRWTPCPVRLSSNPVRRYPHVWISTRGLGSSGTLNHLKRVLPGTHYDPLRLPNVHLGFVRSSLSAPDTLFAPLLLLTGQVRALPSSAWITPLWLTGTHQPDLLCHKETSGSPELPSYPHECMPWSHTPAVSRSLAIS